ncbi:hypothetical protein ACN28E_00830 [Archangium lansingense]|uniref:hypothetical protein n=1 Tax=Archangium lansingense TaxID=2995310 RepID=UPI003B78E02C
MSAPATSTALQETPCCAHHPGQEAVGTCARCGAFYCEAESIRHGEHTYCESCGGRPEVGHLERLERLWDARENNPLARHALVCGLAGLVVPVAAPLAMGLGVAGLRRVNLEATPPIGKRQQALAGLVLGGLGLVGWTGFVLWRLSQGRPLLP